MSQITLRQQLIDALRMVKGLETKLKGILDGLKTTTT